VTKIGFIIDSVIPDMHHVMARKCSPLSLFRGALSESPMGFMRFGWIADAVNRADTGLTYELYRPLRQYDVVVFLKSMDERCLCLQKRLANEGVVTVFDCNVDYVTRACGTFRYEGMAPTNRQRNDALAMLASVDGVIADSEHIAEVCKTHADSVCWIPDNVRMDLGRKSGFASGCESGMLKLFWSGASCKLFELLAIEDVLRSFGKRISLTVVTDSFGGVERCFEPWRSSIKSLLKDLDAEVIAFDGIDHLMDLYGRGGVAISPRFLDNSYNQGHTEWKVALPMATGCPALCSPQRSYETLAKEHLGAPGLRVCGSDSAWASAFEFYLSDGVDWESEGRAVRATIQEHYSTEAVAKKHVEYLKKLLATKGRNCE